MTIRLDLGDQILPILKGIEQDPSMLNSEFPKVIGRILSDSPDAASLRELRSELAATAARIRGEQGMAGIPGENSSTADVVTGFADVIAGYVSRAESRASDEEGTNPPLRKRILTCLLDGPARPSELADQLNRGRPQISEALGRLAERDLVSSDPSLIDGRSREFIITDRGREVAR